MKRLFTLTLFLLCILGTTAFAGELCSKNMTPVFQTPPPSVEQSKAKLEIEFLNVEQGDCIFLRLPPNADGHRTTVLIDGGTTPNGPNLDAASVGIAQSVKVELGKWFPGGEKTLDYLIITHPDRDHYNLVPYIVGNLDVKKVIHIGETGDPRTDNGDNRYQGLWTQMLLADGKKKYGTRSTNGAPDVTMIDFLNTCSSSHRVPDVLRLEQEKHDKLESPGNPLISHSSVEFYVLSARVPYGNGHTASNTGSIVILVHYGDFEAIFQGDGTRLTETAMLDHYASNSLKVELLKVGHHGSDGSSSPAWLDKTHPLVAVISAGKNSTFRHPRKSVCTDLVDRAHKNAPLHQFSWYPDRKKVQSFTSTRAAVFNTHDSHNILITTDGKDKFWVQPGFSKN